MATNQDKVGLGVVTLSSRFYWAVLGQDAAGLTLLDRRRELVPQTMTVAQLMMWYSGRLSSLMASHKPTIVAVRLPTFGRNGFGPAMEFVEKAVFPNAIVHYLCQREDPIIPVLDYVNQSFTLQRFGLAKQIGKTTTELLSEACDATFAHSGPYWDDNQKGAVLAAWLALRP